jgi:AcrR family transcriptional regulator
MSTQRSTFTEALADGAISRKPRQGRSQASFERMIAATRALMLERGSEDFTLQDVSERGSVSIGSIYLRFESKDKLLHAVIAQELEAIIVAERALIAEVLGESRTLDTFVTRYIKRYSEFLAGHALILRMIMQRAAVDPAVSKPGKETAWQSERMSVDAILTFRDEIKAADPRRKAQAVFLMVYATIARQFGLGANIEAAEQRVWEIMETELASMAIAYLRYGE